MGGDESEEMGMLAGQFIGTSNTEDAVAVSIVDSSYGFEWPEPISKRVVIKPITAPEEPTVPPVVDGADNFRPPLVRRAKRGRLTRPENPLHQSNLPKRLPQIKPKS